ncbi:DUF4037 domain-containing protein [Couchioplanes caeruleus]|uniref:DUF4037 domain-containing protein n=1 Tax=Couchioplanes caeruleus TaxID=56438 RepID=UPI0020C06F68|nr:DUF4037 domain-containing protein [Couchioplanes caeruleus]UQU61478.1 DUF4037 domain-containing protein [Couchioplanes caeruleus]
MPGLDLSRRFYEQAVRPLLGDIPHAAALLGPGSEVLGLDDHVSPDHDFGPRVQLFLPPAAVAPDLSGLPARFDGHHGHRVEVTTAAAYFTARLGADPAAGLTTADWLLTPTQVLATLTAGAVFHDPDGELARRRAALSWYPRDIWRYALAAAWLRVAQEEAFPSRAGAAGDDLGSRVVTARLVRELMRLAFLVERRWAPYAKWLGTAFTRLDLAAHAGPPLAAALSATGWRDREDALVRAANVLAAATNDLGLAPAVDPAPRRYFTRDIRVLGADRFVTALTSAVEDAEVRALLGRLGGRRGGPVGTLPGTIDQAVDSTEILTDPARCRRAAAVLGLPADPGVAR